MPIGGGQPAAYDPEQARRKREETAALRDYDIDELKSLLLPDEIMAVQAHQVSSAIFELLTHPIPPELERSNPLGAIALLFNTIDFDEKSPGTEDVIYADKQMTEILRLPSDANRAKLLRARRSVLGYLILTDALPKYDVA